MNFQAILTLWLQTSVVLICAMLACAVVRKSPSARLAICKVGLLGALLAALVLPSLYQPSKTAVSIDIPRFTLNVDRRSSITPASAVAPESSAAATVAPSRVLADSAPDPQLLMYSTWIVGSILLAALTALGYIRLYSLRKTCNLIESGRAFDLLTEASASMNVGAPNLMVGDQIPTPFVSGVRNPTLYLPSSWLDGTDEETLKAVFRHEVAHVAAKDLHWNLLFRVATVLFWPQPFLWLLRNRYAASSEEVCDLQVLNSGYTPASYANALLNLRESLGLKRRRVPVGIGAVSNRSAFGRRIESIMDASLGSARKLSMRGKAGVAVAMAAVVFAGASIFPGSPQTVVAQDLGPRPEKLNVKILMPNGKLAQAGWSKVELTDEEGNRKWIEAPMVNGYAKADLKGQGNFQSVVLAALVPESGLSFIQVWPSAEPVDTFKVAKPGMVRGQLLDPKGEPIRAPAPLSVVPATLVIKMSERRFLVIPDDLRMLLESGIDANGFFRLDRLPRNAEIHVDIRTPTYANLMYPERRLELKDQELTELPPIKLAIQGIFEGRVTRNGQPVAGVKIGAQDNHVLSTDRRGLWGEAVTDTDGRYRMTNMAAGAYNLILDERSTKLEVTAVAHEGLSIKAGETKTGLDFELIDGATVEGRVTNNSGSPLRGVHIGIYGPSHPESSAWVQTCITDADGKYRLRVPPGKNRVYVADGRWEAPQELVTVPSSGTKTVNFNVHPARKQ